MGTSSTSGVSVTKSHAGWESKRPSSSSATVGADGLHSNVRRLVFGRETNVEHYLGCVVAAAVVVDGYQPRNDLVYMTYSAPGHSVGRFALRNDQTMLGTFCESCIKHVPIR